MSQENFYVLGAFLFSCMSSQADKYHLLRVA